MAVHKNTGDIRNNRENNSRKALQKAAYRQFNLAHYGHFGKGNKQFCPSCVDVIKIREQWPSITRVYTEYKEH